MDLLIKSTERTDTIATGLLGWGGGALLYKPDIGMCRPKGCRFECFGLKTGLDFDYFVLIV